jgi:hypothetical protein
MANVLINRKNGNIFIKNEPLAAILKFQFSPNSFPDILSPIPTPMLNFKRTFATFRARTRKVYGRGGGMTTKP